MRRELGLFAAVMLGIGGTLSAGNFVILGYAAGLTGTSIVVIVLICGVISALTMLSYCELSTAIPLAGSEYTWSKVAFGGFVAFMTGWFQWTSNVFYAALSSLGIAYMLNYFIPVDVTLTAILIALAFTVVNIRGVKEATYIEGLITLLVIVALTFYVAGGLGYTLEAGSFRIYASRGLLGCLEATAYLFELYLGAEAIAVAQAEIKNPERSIPRAMIISSAASIVLYTSVTYVTVRLVPIETLAKQTSPIAFAMERMAGKVGATLISAVIIVAGLASVNSAVMAQSRILYAMSRDGYLPRILSRIHGRYQTPYFAAVVSSIFTSALILTGAINFVVYAVNFGFIIGFALVNLSLIRLRGKNPGLRRPFKSPMFPAFPVMGILVSILLLFFIEVDALMLGIELILFALLIYYLKMVGYGKIRLAFAGINMGIGSAVLLSATLIGYGFIPITWIPAQSRGRVIYGLILLGAIYLIASLHHIYTPRKR